MESKGFHILVTNYITNWMIICYISDNSNRANIQDEHRPLINRLEWRIQRASKQQNNGRNSVSSSEQHETGHDRGSEPQRGD